MNKKIIISKQEQILTQIINIFFFFNNFRSTIKILKFFMDFLFYQCLQYFFKLNQKTKIIKFTDFNIVVVEKMNLKCSN